MKKKYGRKHPNKIPFTGILAYVDRASEKAPSGARGHRIILTRIAAESALDTLVGMCVNCNRELDHHDYSAVVGIVERAWMEADRIHVAGYIFAYNFPDLLGLLDSNPRLGMSYEIADCHVDDMRAEVWTLNKVTFTGAAILAKDRAAYAGTSFELDTRLEVIP